LPFHPNLWPKMNPLFYCSPLVPFNYVPMYLPNIIHALEPCYHSVVVHPSTTKGNYVPMYLPNFIHALEPCYDSIVVHPSTTKSIMYLCTYPISSMHWNHVITQLWFIHPQPSHQGSILVTYTRNSPTSLSQHLGN